MHPEIISWVNYKSDFRRYHSYSSTNSFQTNATFNFIVSYSILSIELINLDNPNFSYTKPQILFKLYECLLMTIATGNLDHVKQLFELAEISLKRMHNP